MHENRHADAHHCKCTLCRERKRLYNIEYRAKRKAGISTSHKRPPPADLSVSHPAIIERVGLWRQVLEAGEAGRVADRILLKKGTLPTPKQLRLMATVFGRDDYAGNPP